jgi:hypothetical protein
MGYRDTMGYRISDVILGVQVKQKSQSIAILALKMMIDHPFSQRDPLRRTLQRSM